MIDRLIKWFHKTFFKPYRYVRSSSISRDFFGNLVIIYWSDGEVQQFVGNCTVWYEYPKVKRCDTDVEAWLSDLEQYHSNKGKTFINYEKSR